MSYTVQPTAGLSTKLFVCNVIRLDGCVDTYHESALQQAAGVQIGITLLGNNTVCKPYLS